MMLVFLYALALIALAIGTAAIYMALLRPFPVSWLYHHYFLRKPVVWTLLAAGVAVVAWTSRASGTFPLGALPPLLLLALAVLLTYRMHQETAFPAVDFPAMAADPLALPLRDDMELAVVDHGGVSKAYPLDYVIHHHIVNDHFGDALVALTYCAMCRSIVAFDVTDLGPLFVGSFKNANMIVADRRTKTFFQQATFESLIGPLHPRTLPPVPYQILSWTDVKRLEPLPQVAAIRQADLRAFELPIPGIWRRIVASEATPGLSRSQRDRSFPARTRVVGVLDPAVQPSPVYLKDELLARGIVENEEAGLYLVARNGTINGFAARVDGRELELAFDEHHRLRDRRSGTVWDLRGHRIDGEIGSDLVPVPVSDEYWFSWKRFHPETRIVRLGSERS